MDISFSYNLSKDKQVTTSKKTNTSQDNAVGKRRNSISSSKNNQIAGRPRSNSLPKEPVGIMTSISKIRENLLNSPEFKKISSSKSLLKENNNNTEESGHSGSKQLSVAPSKRVSVSILS